MKFLCFLYCVATLFIRTAAKNGFEVEGILDHGKIKAMNAPGGFPANPTYLVYQQFLDEQCNELAWARSEILDTCVASSKNSARYTCGNCKSFPPFLLLLKRPLLYYSKQQRYIHHFLGYCMYNCFCGSFFAVLLVHESNEVDYLLDK